MKIAVINFSGNVGKTTIARHLLLPRIPGAELITVESVNADEGQAQAPGQHTLDCSMCLAPALPLPPVSLAVAQPHPLAAALHPFAAAHIAALVGAPLPPRGPPAQA